MVLLFNPACHDSHSPENLFVTNSKHGQANVILSIVHQLVLRSNVAVHITSFSGMQVLRSVYIFHWHQLGLECALI